jgi:hypothetical protein
VRQTVSCTVLKAGGGSRGPSPSQRATRSAEIAIGEGWQASEVNGLARQLDIRRGVQSPTAEVNSDMHFPFGSD